MTDPAGSIYVVQDDRQLIRLDACEYEREADFQQLLQDFPDLLAGDQIDPAAPRRWMFVSREVAVPDAADSAGRWALDHLFVDQDAVPTLVEVKRQTDSRLRREVVGQMLDYAANAVAYWPGDAMREQHARACEALGDDPDAALRRLLGENANADAFWATAHANLRAGRVRLVFVADLIPRELQRIVEFLNERMSPTEVLAVELRQYAGGGLRTHIPRVVGQTAAAQVAKAPSRSGGRTAYERVQLADSDFLAYVAAHGHHGVRDVFEGIMSWVRARPDLLGWAERKGQVAFKVHFATEGRPGFAHVYTPAPGGKDGRFHHNWFHAAPFVREVDRGEFFARIASIPGLDWTADEAFERRSIPTAALAAPGALAHLLDTLEWGLARVNDAGRDA